MDHRYEVDLMNEEQALLEEQAELNIPMNDEATMLVVVVQSIRALVETMNAH